MPSNSQTLWVYMLLCENQSFYTGFTTDLAKRFQAHCDGTSRCKYTRSFKPLEIAQRWQVSGTQNDALKVERYIKSLSRKDKLLLVTEPDRLTKTMESRGILCFSSCESA